MLSFARSFGGGVLLNPRDFRAVVPSLKSSRVFSAFVFCPFRFRGLRSGEEMVVGKSRLNLRELSELSVLVEDSFSFCKFLRIKLNSSQTFLIFLPQAWQTRSDKLPDLSIVSPIFEHISAKVSFANPSRFGTLKRFCVEMCDVFLKSPYLILSGQQQSLQLSLTLAVGCSPALTCFFGVSPFDAIETPHRRFVLISRWLFPALFAGHLFFAPSTKFHITIYPLIGWDIRNHRICHQFVKMQMAKRERFPLLRTSLLKMHDFPLFPGGASELLAVFRTYLNFGKNKKRRNF